MSREIRFKDIFIEFWYRRIIIAIIAVIAIVCSFVNVAVNNRKVKSSTDVDTVYTKTICVNIDAKEKSPYFDIFSQSQKLRNSYYAACNSEYFAKYLIENIESEKDLSVYLVPGENNDFNIADKNMSNVLKAFNFENSADSTSIKLSFKCYNDEIGDKIVNLFIPYMKDNLQPKLGGAEFVEIDRSSFEEKGSSSIISKTSLIKSLIKKIIVFGVLFEAVYLIIVLFRVMIVPKVHTIDEIKKCFDVPVWEIK